jgi:hypothetical protein
MQPFSDVLLQAHLPPESVEPFKNVILPFTLRPHQVLGIQCGLYWDRFGLYHDVSTGKTIVMQLLALFYANYGMKSTFLLPPILFDQFVDEYKRIKGHNLNIVLIEGDAKKKLDMLQSYALSPSEAPDIVVTTSQIFSGPFGKKRKAGRSSELALLRQVYRLLVLRRVSSRPARRGVVDLSGD